MIDIGVKMLDASLYRMGYREPNVVLGITHQQVGHQKDVGLLGKWKYENYTVADMLLVG